MKIWFGFRLRFRLRSVAVTIVIVISVIAVVITTVAPGNIAGTGFFKVIFITNIVNRIDIGVIFLSQLKNRIITVIVITNAGVATLLITQCPGTRIFIICISQATFILAVVIAGISIIGVVVLSIIVGVISVSSISIIIVLLFFGICVIVAIAVIIVAIAVIVAIAIIIAVVIVSIIIVTAVIAVQSRVQVDLTQLLWLLKQALRGLAGECLAVVKVGIVTCIKRTLVIGYRRPAIVDTGQESTTINHRFMGGTANTDAGELGGNFVVIGVIVADRAGNGTKTALNHVHQGTVRRATGTVVVIFFKGKNGI